MTARTQHKRSFGLGRIAQTAWRSLVSASLMLSPVATANSAHAAISNTAIVSGSTPRGGPISSNPSNEVVTTVAPAPSMNVSKFGSLNDDDGNPGVTAGDTIDYVVTVRNTGNVSLTNVVANDPLVTLTLVGGDTDSDGELDVNETWLYSGSYTLTGSDLATNGGGDGDIDNTVTISSDQLPDQSDTEETPFSTAASMRATKTATLNDDDGTPGLSAGDTISYFITLENTAVTTLTNITEIDTLVQGASSTNLVLSGPIGDTDGDNQLDPGETWQYTTSYVLSQANLDDGRDITNTVRFDSDETAPTEADVVTPLNPGALVPSYTMTKTATLVDGDADGLGDVGETVNYTFRFTNTGNITLANLAVNDPLTGLSPIVCAPDLDSDGDIDQLLPFATANCTATYTIVQADVDAGNLTNTATTTASTLVGGLPVTEDDSANDNSTTTPTDGVREIQITKTASSPVQVFPNVYDIDYTINLTNTGSVNQTNLSLQDDLDATLPAGTSLVATPAVSISGFAGTGGANGGYNGTSDIELFTGDVRLAPGASGLVTISMRIQVSGPSNLLNTAFVNSDQTPSPIPSDDPTETPGDNSDINPTPTVIIDTDNDGSNDGDESPTNDRDLDGIPDSQDYDPTGYLYCEDDGRILTGGRISVENLTSGGIQTGVGSSNNITIVRDGSDGLYQFFVNQTGRYRLSLSTLPGSSSLSTSRPPSGTLDVTSLLPSNPAIIGSGANGSPLRLLDTSVSANPYYFDFDIEAGDPTIFNNNLPVQLCGFPNLLIAKSVLSGPDLVPGGNSITYQTILENTGTLRAENIQLVDNLDAVFGAGNYNVTAVNLTSSPVGFGALANNSFNGGTDPNLLTNGGILQPGENIVATFTVTTTVTAGTFTNSVVGQGTNPADGSPLTEPVASIDITIAGSGGEQLVVTKASPLDEAAIGETVPYEVRISNPNNFPRIGVEFVDSMPAGFTYIPGTATIDGVAAEPAIKGRELAWRNRTIPASSLVVLRFQLRVGAAASGTEFVNSAYIRDPATGEIISNIAKAIVRLKIEPVFQCSDLIGRVFDDLDADGYYDDGEPGLAKVRIATVNGLLVTTDNFGRFHVACGAIPDDKIGSNFIMKVDPRTLPSGYSLTSENPRVVRLTRGKLTKINFAAALLQEVKLGLNDKSFVRGTTRLTRNALLDVRKLLPILEKQRSKLVIQYRAENPTRRLSRSRLQSVKKLIDAAWKTRDREYKLDYDLRMVR